MTLQEQRHDVASWVIFISLFWHLHRSCLPHEKFSFYKYRIILTFVVVPFDRCIGLFWLIYRSHLKMQLTRATTLSPFGWHVFVGSLLTCLLFSFDISADLFWKNCWFLLTYLLVSLDVSTGLFWHIHWSLLAYLLVIFDISVGIFWHRYWFLLTHISHSFDNMTQHRPIHIPKEYVRQKRRIHVKRDVYIS